MLRLLAKTLIFFLPPAPSDISPPVASPSLPEPAPPAMPFLFAPPKEDGIGVPARLPALDAAEVLNLGFLREDSLPLDSERLGEPARFKDLPCLPTPGTLSFCGVVVPFVLAPESLSRSFCDPGKPSAVFFPSSSFSSPSSDESSEDYKGQSLR